MKKAGISKKRPCKVCRRWFSPDPRVGDTQKTCGNLQCKREWHRKKCADWNRKSPEYFKEIYLKNKLAATGEDKQKHQSKIFGSRSRLNLPWQEIQEVIGPNRL